MPVGGGSLLAGTLPSIKSIAPRVKVIGVEPENYDVLRQSLAVGAPVSVPPPGVDAMWVSKLGDEVYRLCDALVDEVISVSSDEVRAARAGLAPPRECSSGMGRAGCNLRARRWDA